MSIATRIKSMLGLVLWGWGDDSSVIKPACEEDLSSGSSTASDSSQPGVTEAPGDPMPAGSQVPSCVVPINSHRHTCITVNNINKYNLTLPFKRVKNKRLPFCLLPKGPVFKLISILSNILNSF